MFKDNRHLSRLEVKSGVNLGLNRMVNKKLDEELGVNGL